ncbi:DUF5677 domain-containing protein [Shewanella sp. YLB-07]|uniref:DUF5677 domain-containing protein n=1 Tax=Shewanella sp. YLB-07 TaxID=2601268 RepID=UPI00128D3133|nr:DUF5677 domain-containing protein [Shewanella sp. YLB-07]MPY21289.1 hypothetical protein [Shewanella sp. YLB-07]MPY22076.1 hypothetical protein [Shewanella sp. YLB-07]
MRYSDHQLSLLKSHCEELLVFCQDNTRCSLDDTDHLGFMSQCFLSKQNDHMSAILRLLPHPDVQLISRTMIEGLVQLLWCFKEPEQAFKWRGYAWINDWRVARDMINNGRDVDPEYASRIEKFIIENGNNFKLNKFKDKPIPENEDPFHKNWRCGKSLKAISKDVGGVDLYAELYSPYSDWQHWGVASIGQMIERDGNGIIYRDSVNSMLCSPLAVAFQCLYQVMERNNSHHELGIKNDLENLKNEYISMLQA